MAVFAISDLHLALGADKPMDIFGPGWADYMARLETNWKTVVRDEDHVIIPGDISWAMNLEGAIPDFKFIHSLPGHKIISKGNHDYYWTSRAKMDKYLAEKGFDSISFMHNNSYLIKSDTGTDTDADADACVDTGADASLVTGTEVIKKSADSDDSADLNDLTDSNDSTNSVDFSGSITLVGPKYGCALIICGTRGWKCPGEDDFSEDDNKIYLRELQRLKLSLDDGLSLIKSINSSNGKTGECKAAVLVAALHYPPFSAGGGSSGFTDIMKQYGVDICLYGHLHGDGIRNKSAVVDGGIEFRLISADYLQFTPHKIL